jgi:hypothetical protein
MLQMGYFSFGGSTVIVVFQQVCAFEELLLSTELIYLCVFTFKQFMSTEFLKEYSGFRHIL